MTDPTRGTEKSRFWLRAVKTSLPVLGLGPWYFATCMSGQPLLQPIGHDNRMQSNRHTNGSSATTGDITLLSNPNRNEAAPKATQARISSALTARPSALRSGEAISEDDTPSTWWTSIFRTSSPAASGVFSAYSIDDMSVRDCIYFLSQSMGNCERQRRS